MKEARPTSGKVLLALFSILGSVDGLSFLDIFAGTGRVGIEALKRGAGPVVFVETLKKRAQEITGALPRQSEASVFSMDLRQAVRLLKAQEKTFDVIFADPPYHENWGSSLLKTKDLFKLLAPRGTMIVEHSSREVCEICSPWSLKETRLYGETALTFLSVAETPDKEGDV